MVDAFSAFADVVVVCREDYDFFGEVGVGSGEHCDHAGSEDEFVSIVFFAGPWGQAVLCESLLEVLSDGLGFP